MPAPSRPSARPARRLLGVAPALGLALVLGACSATNPMTTMANYDASDGVSVEVGDLDVRNVLVLAAEEGGPGTLVAAATNRGADQLTARLTVEGATATVRLDARETVVLGPEQDRSLEIDAVGVRPGGFVDVEIQADAGTTTLRAPVLDGSLPEYADLVP